VFRGRRMAGKVMNHTVPGGVPNWELGRGWETLSLSTALPLVKRYHHADLFRIFLYLAVSTTAYARFRDDDVFPPEHFRDVCALCYLYRR
jgi:hypothetical protein